MAEYIRINRISSVGIAHTEEHVGDRLDAAMIDTNITVRVYVAGRLTEVHSYSGVSGSHWLPAVPDLHIESKENT